jgi:hypothetical protein
MWIDPGFTQVLRRLGSFATVVVFDPRGLGLSFRLTTFSGR